MGSNTNIEKANETSQYDLLVDKIASLKKVYEIEEFMSEYNIRRNYAMDRYLQRLIEFSRKWSSISRLKM